MMAEAGWTQECMQTKGGSCRRMSEATAARGSQVAGVLAQIGAIQPMAFQTPGRHDAISEKLVRDALLAHCPELLAAALRVAAALALTGFQPPQRIAQRPDV